MTLSPTSPSADDLVLPHIVRQHREETAHLVISRARLVSAPGITLAVLEEHDQRLAAHLDGLRVAGAVGRAISQAAADDEALMGADAFAAAVLALEAADSHSFLALVRAGCTEAVLSTAAIALGWVSAANLRGIVAQLLDSDNFAHRHLGLAACRQHGVDPGKRLRAWIRSNEPSPAASAIEAAADLAIPDALDLAVSIDSDDAELQFQVARASICRGDATGRRVLAELALSSSARSGAALDLALRALPLADANRLLRSIAVDPARARDLVRGAGIVGDSAIVPWLIEQMFVPALGRVAGESFTAITGVDLERAGCTAVSTDVGPNEEDADMAADDALDEGLPRPDPQLVADWWQMNGATFPSGTRLFFGGPPAAAHALTILRTGHQRQRIAAAQTRYVSMAGEPLFNTAAPAWRQLRRLDRLGANAER